MGSGRVRRLLTAGSTTPSRGSLWRRAHSSALASRSGSAARARPPCAAPPAGTDGSRPPQATTGPRPWPRAPSVSPRWWPQSAVTEPRRLLSRWPSTATPKPAILHCRTPTKQPGRLGGSKASAVCGVRWARWWRGWRWVPPCLDEEFSTQAAPERRDHHAPAGRRRDHRRSTVETVNSTDTRGSWSLLACEGVQDASDCRRRVRRAGNPDGPSNPGDRGGRGSDPRSGSWSQSLRLDGRRWGSKGREGTPLPPDTGL